MQESSDGNEIESVSPGGDGGKQISVNGGNVFSAVQHSVSFLEGVCVSYTEATKRNNENICLSILLYMFLKCDNFMFISEFYPCFIIQN